MNSKFLVALLGITSASARCVAAPVATVTPTVTQPELAPQLVDAQPMVAAKSLLSAVDAAQGEVAALEAAGVPDTAQVLGEALEKVKGARASVEELGLIQGVNAAAVRDRVRAAQGVVDGLRAAKVRLSSIQNSQQAQDALGKALTQAQDTLAAEKRWIVSWQNADASLRAARELLQQVAREQVEWDKVSAQAQASLRSSREAIAQSAEATRKAQATLAQYAELQALQPEREARLKRLEEQQRKRAVLEAFEEQKRDDVAKQQSDSVVEPNAWRSPRWRRLTPYIHLTVATADRGRLWLIQEAEEPPIQPHVPTDQEVFDAQFAAYKADRENTRAQAELQAWEADGRAADGKAAILALPGLIVANDAAAATATKAADALAKAEAADAKAQADIDAAEKRLKAANAELENLQKQCGADLTAAQAEVIAATVALEAAKSRKATTFLDLFSARVENDKAAKDAEKAARSLRLQQGVADAYTQVVNDADKAAKDLEQKNNDRDSIESAYKAEHEGRLPLPQDPF